MSAERCFFMRVQSSVLSVFLHSNLSQYCSHELSEGLKIYTRMEWLTVKTMEARIVFFISEGKLFRIIIECLYVKV